MDGLHLCRRAADCGGPVGHDGYGVLRIGDHLDSLAQKTDSTGDLLGVNDISPYGELISNTAADRLLFTQHERDTENGSDAALYRQYSSAQGRWLSPDPSSASYDLTDPQSLNRYAYLGNRPDNATDPLGLDDEGCGLTCIGIDVAVTALVSDIEGWFGGGGGYHGNPHSTARHGLRKSGPQSCRRGYFP
jgi:RHS repeat-associated protein